MSSNEAFSGIKESENLVINNRKNSEVKLRIKQFWKENDNEEKKE